MEGVVTLDEQIDDKATGPRSDDHSDALHCWIYPYYYLHKDQNLARDQELVQLLFLYDRRPAGQFAAGQMD